MCVLHFWHSKNPFGPGFQDSRHSKECANVLAFFSNPIFSLWLWRIAALALHSRSRELKTSRNSRKRYPLRGVSAFKNSTKSSVYVFVCPSLIYRFLTPFWVESFLDNTFLVSLNSSTDCAARVWLSVKQLYIFALNVCVCVWKSLISSRFASVCTKSTKHMFCLLLFFSESTPTTTRHQSFHFYRWFSARVYFCFRVCNYGSQIITILYRKRVTTRLRGFVCVCVCVTVSIVLSRRTAATVLPMTTFSLLGVH